MACRATVKAVDAAINSRQWLKAVQILEVIPNKPEAKQYYHKIAQHHANIGDYAVCYWETNHLSETDHLSETNHLSETDILSVT